MDVSDIDANCNRATVHNVVVELSPVKASRKNRKAQQWKEMVRMVSILVSYFREVVCPTAAQCKWGTARSNQGLKLEAASGFYVLQSGTVTIYFARRFNLIEPECTVQLNELEDLAINQCVTIMVKAMSLEEPVTV